MPRVCIREPCPAFPILPLLRLATCDVTDDIVVGRRFERVNDVCMQRAGWAVGMRRKIDEVVEKRVRRRGRRNVCGSIVQVSTIIDVVLFKGRLIGLATVGSWSWMRECLLR